MSEKIRSFSFNKKDLLLLFLLLVGVIVRVIRFGEAPTGFNQNEAFAGYEAFSLLNYGVDSFGYRYPCYFVAWGSGMNVLESYLAIPFMKLFGCSVTRFRLPQLLLSCLSLPIFYALLRRVFSERTALLGLGLLAISPWHILLSRWGLESNLAPAVLLIALYFFIRGITDNKYWILSALFYGASLYAYATTWVVVPLTLLSCGIYLLVKKVKFANRYTILSVALLFLLALPLILFVLVNKEIIPEISTPFFSVPKMLYMRSSEVSLKNLFLPETYYNFFRIFLKQEDGLIWNTPGEFGLFYGFSLPFILLGGVKLVKNAVTHLRDKEICYDVILMLGMACSILSCLLVSHLNVNKANSLHFYTLILLTLGIREVAVIASNHKIIPRAVLCGYALSFLFFCSYYFGAYQDALSPVFNSGLGEAIQYAKTQNSQEICVDASVYHSQVLFFDQTPQNVYQSTVEYTNYPAAYLKASKFSCYTFGIDYNDLKEDTVYILKTEKRNTFISQGYQVRDFENFSVAVKKN